MGFQLLMAICHHVFVIWKSLFSCLFRIEIGNIEYNLIYNEFSGKQKNCVLKCTKLGGKKTHIDIWIVCKIHMNYKHIYLIYYL